MNINSWLKEIGLQEYSELFNEKKITWSKLKSITKASQLKDLGIASSIIRDKILFEISKLNSGKTMGKTPALPAKNISKSTSSKSRSGDVIKRIHPSPKKVLNEYEEAILKK